MQPKKNPEADLNKNRNLYFVIGLTLVLGFTWAAVEYKTYDRQLNFDGVNMLEDDEDDVPITEQLKTPPPPPPPPPPAPEVIEIVEDEEEVEETVIESTESDEEMIIEDIVVEDDFEDIDVPFAVIEDVPIFPGCERVAKSQRRTCFQDQMNKHIRKNFGKLVEGLSIPNLIEVQKNSYNEFLESKSLKEQLNELTKEVTD